MTVYAAFFPCGIEYILVLTPIHREDNPNVFSHYAFYRRSGLGQELGLTWKRCDLSLDTLLR